MRTEQKTNVKNGIARLIFILAAITLQIYWLVGLVQRLNDRFSWISPVITAASVVVALYVFGRHTSSSIRIPWIILILVFPFVGVALYILIGIDKIAFGGKKRFSEIDRILFPMIQKDPQVLEEMGRHSRSAANISRYLQETCGFPVYRNTEVTYYGDTREALRAQKEAMGQAKRFIFLEYHAIQEAEAFGGILHILKQKAAEGVEVRIFYDDMGSISFISTDFIRRMAAYGIQVRVFNRLVPLLDVFMNNRDHRKITVIDGKIGFTGGYNLADEYFNIVHPYGQWKDSGIRLQGEAVRTLTMLFLEMWTSIHRGTFNQRVFEPYLADASLPAAGEYGFIQPYGDSPLSEEHVGENVCMHILNRAKDYVWFTTPYLMITDELARSMRLAARRGVDVRLILPGIPDKKAVYAMSRSYYSGLVHDGVRIFEYTPGFLHAKQCVSDDMVATVGTINLDFRSLFEHFENGCYMYGTHAVMDIRSDFRKLFAESREVTQEYRGHRSIVKRVIQCVLRLIAPQF